MVATFSPGQDVKLPLMKFGHMVSMYKKLTVYLFVFLFVVHFGDARAGIVDRCTGPWGCCFVGLINTHEKPSLAKKFIEHGCCTSSAGIPCGMKNNRKYGEPIFTGLNPEENVQKADGFNKFKNRGYSCSHNLSRRIPAYPFWITTDPIPLYLQNRTFLF